MSERKKALIIAYHYPPLAGAGMLKILRTTRYLSRYGWEPLVLTVLNPEPYHRAENPIPDDVRVFRAWRIPGGNLVARILRRLKIDDRMLLLPDQYLFWVPGVFFYGWHLIRKEKTDLIYVTSPPYSVLIAATLLKLVTGKKLVVDIRDPWTFNAARRGYPSGLHRRWDQMLEQWILRQADYITCIYRITENGYRERYPWLAAKIAVFYDTVDRRDLPIHCEREIRDDTRKPFTLTYLGTFYPPFQSLRATLHGIQSLLQSGAIEPGKFIFRYVGPPDKAFEAMIQELGLVSLVSRAGYKTMPEALSEAFNSQVLLLLLEFATINTKLFDYLASGNAILAVVPPCAELSGLLARYAGRYNLVTDNDAVKIAQCLKECYNDYYQGHLNPDLERRDFFLQEMNIESETKDLTAVFNRLTSNPPVS